MRFLNRFFNGFCFVEDFGSGTKSGKRKNTQKQNINVFSANVKSFFEKIFFSSFFIPENGFEIS